MYLYEFETNELLIFDPAYDLGNEEYVVIFEVRNEPCMIREFLLSERGMEVLNVETTVAKQPKKFGGVEENYFNHISLYGLIGKFFPVSPFIPRFLSKIKISTLNMSFLSLSRNNLKYGSSIYLYLISVAFTQPPFPACNMLFP